MATLQPSMATLHPEAVDGQMATLRLEAVEGYVSPRTQCYEKSIFGGVFQYGNAD
jgi:hypothetical protein